MRRVHSLRFDDTPAVHNRVAVVILDSNLSGDWSIALNGTDHNGDPVFGRYLTIDNIANIAPVMVRINGIENTISPYTRTTYNLTQFTDDITFQLVEGEVKLYIAENTLNIPNEQNQLASGNAFNMGIYLNRDGTTPMLANLDHGNFKGTNLAPPTLATDAVNRGWIDSLGFIMAANYPGYDPTGVADCYAAIVAANADAVAQNKTLILTGVARVASKIVLNDRTHWIMTGGHFVPGELGFGSCLLKDAGLTDDLIEVGFNASGSVFENINIIAFVGNTRNGFYVLGTYVTLRNCSVQGCGDAGFRIGADVAGATNSNCFLLDGCKAAFNNFGFVFDDASNAPVDANAGTASNCRAYNNVQDGFYVDRAQWGNVFSGLLAETNGRYGLNVLANAQTNVFIGGDFEGNTTANLNEVPIFQNRFIGVVLQGVVYNDRHRSFAFVPTVSGLAVAGVGTYTTQEGFIHINERLLNFELVLDWTAHTGAGGMIVDLPAAPYDVDNVTAGVPQFIVCSILTSGIAFAAGAQITAAIGKTTNKIIINETAAGANVAKALPPTGQLYISGHYKINTPN